MPGPLVIRDGLVVPEHELQWRFSRSGGPGGQSVNTSDTRAELSFDIAASPSLTETQRSRALRRLAPRLARGVITIAASEHRSQLQNRKAAELRLAQVLVEATAPPAKPRRPTRPTQAARRRRLEAKRQRGEIKRLRRSRDED